MRKGQPEWLRGHSQALRSVPRAGGELARPWASQLFQLCQEPGLRALSQGLALPLWVTLLRAYVLPGSFFFFFAMTLSSCFLKMSLKKQQTDLQMLNGSVLPHRPGLHGLHPALLPQFEQESSNSPLGPLAENGETHKNASCSGRDLRPDAGLALPTPSHGTSPSASSCSSLLSNTKIYLFLPHSQKQALSIPPEAREWLRAPLGPTPTQTV